MLTDKQERFCKEYIIDCNATQAAIPGGIQPAQGACDRRKPISKS